MIASCQPAFKALAKHVRQWYQILTRTRKTHSGRASQEARSSPVARLPPEIVGMIIDLIYETRSLLACSLTCCSWYIAAAPHLHHTLATLNSGGMFPPKSLWPKPLRDMHKLGLLPLVKKLQVQGSEGFFPKEFSPQMFNCRILRHFFALTNVQELGIDYLNIPKFMPRIRRYFGRFSPTVRSLALRAPRGSRRQIIYFIGLFQHLENLKLFDGWADIQGESVDDLTLTPPSAPPLHGRLTMSRFMKAGLLEDMINLFGGIHFRHMDLCNVEGTRLLLGACAETLETLRLYPADPRGE